MFVIIPPGDRLKAASPHSLCRLSLFLGNVATMHRVITKFRDRHGAVITERGPWHTSRDSAEHWAEMLKICGYQVKLESHGGPIGGGGGGNSNQDLANALASMA